MPRRYRRLRRTRPLKTVKYSNETMTVGLVGSNAVAETAIGNYVALIAPVEAQGTRKCKNFTLTICNTADPFYWALVYVPQGTEPGNLSIGEINANHGGSASFYEPNQNVILSGVSSNPGPQSADPTSIPRGTTTIHRTRLARNLNSGDYICFIFVTLAKYATANSGHVLGSISLNYAISY